MLQIDKACCASKCPFPLVHSLLACLNLLNCCTEVMIGRRKDPMKAIGTRISALLDCALNFSPARLTEVCM